MIKNLYLSTRFFYGIAGVICLFLAAYLFPILLLPAKVGLAIFILFTIVDIFLLFRIKNACKAERICPEKLSNGDLNKLSLKISNQYPFDVQTQLIDEIPFQFQERDILYNLPLESGEEKVTHYELRPTARGEYNFGKLHVFVSTLLGLIKRRYSFPEEKTIPVYPSFIQMQKYELLAFSNQLQEYGLKKIRRIGHSMEFEQIRDYVVGDDYRHINWKATPRRNQLMVNQFTEEKSQPIYAIIDKGRVMKMPFEGLSLLDYAINAALVISNIAVKKGDKAGLITFADKMGHFVKAQSQVSQIRNIQEILYNVDTNYLETNYANLFATLRAKLNRRSLLLLFTNFETLTALRRQLPYFRRINKHHLLVVVLFENTELHELTHKPASTIERIYIKTIAEKFAFEKKLIVKELQMHGIQAILTIPEDLTVNTINKYLELKARGMI